MELNLKAWMLLAAIAILASGCLDVGQQKLQPSQAATAIPPSAGEPTAILQTESEEDASIELNSLVYERMVEAGIEDALVDVGKERVLIGFVLPLELSKENAVAFAMGVAAGFHPEAESIVIQLAGDDGAVVEEYETTPPKIAATSGENGSFEKLLQESKVSAG